MRQNQFITGQDIGVSQQMIAVMQRETKNAVGTKFDVSFYTASVLTKSLNALLEHVYQKPVSDFSCTVQGVGHVGSYVVKNLHDLGCTELNICDVDQKSLDHVIKEHSKVKIVENDIAKINTEIFIPCAIGGLIHQDNITNLQFKVICGSANNILLDPEKDAEKLCERNVLYAPDYLVNSGGLVAAFAEWKGFDDKQIMEIVDKVPGRLIKLYDNAEEQNIEKVLDEYCYKILFM